MCWISNWKVKSKIEVLELRKYQTFFYQFSFPIQYFANFWIIHNALRSVSCSIYLYLSRQKSSEKNYSLYNQTAWLVTLPKEGSKLKNIFPSDKIGFYHTVFLFFCFTRNELIKWIPGVNLYGPKIKKGTISRVARRGNTHLFGLGGYVSLGYNVFWVLSLKRVRRHPYLWPP